MFYDKTGPIIAEGIKKYLLEQQKREAKKSSACEVHGHDNEPIGKDYPEKTRQLLKGVN